MKKPDKSKHQKTNRHRKICTIQLVLCCKIQHLDTSLLLFLYTPFVRGKKKSQHHMLSCYKTELHSFLSLADCPSDRCSTSATERRSICRELRRTASSGGPGTRQLPAATSPASPPATSRYRPDFSAGAACDSRCRCGRCARPRWPRRTRGAGRGSAERAGRGWSSGRARGTRRTTLPAPPPCCRTRTLGCAPPGSRTPLPAGPCAVQSVPPRRRCGGASRVV